MKCKLTGRVREVLVRDEKFSDRETGKEVKFHREVISFFVPDNDNTGMGETITVEVRDGVPPGVIDRGTCLELSFDSMMTKDGSTSVRCKWSDLRIVKSAK